MSVRLLLILSCLLTICNPIFAKETSLGSHNNPIKFAIVPSGHAASALERAKPIITCIEKDSGYFITLQIPNSYIAVAEAMGSHKVDLAFGDISSFLIAQKKYGVEAFLQVVRYGLNYYQSMIFVRSDSPIKTIKDLNGKKFAYPDASSASGYLLPTIEMKKMNIKFGQEVPTGSMEASIIALMQKKVDAAAAYYNIPDAKTGAMHDARARVLGIYPDIEKQTRIIWTSQHIPNEPVFVRAGLPQEVKDKLSVSIIKCIKEHPNMINSMDTLIPITAENNDYNDYIKMLEDSGLDIAKVFSKEKK